MSQDLIVDGTLSVCEINCPSGTLTLPAISSGTLSTCTIVCPGGTLSVQSDMEVGGVLDVMDTLNVCNISCPDGTINFLSPVELTAGLTTCTLSCPSGTIAVTSALDVEQGVSIDGVLEVCTIECPSGTLSILSSVSMSGTLEVCNISCPTGTLQLQNLDVGSLQINNDLTVGGTLEVCSIGCPTGTLQITSPVQMTGTLAVCTIVCGSTTVPVDDILLDVQNSTYTPTNPTDPLGTLVVGSTGGTATIRSLTSTNDTIDIDVVSDGVGGQALNLSLDLHPAIFNITSPVLAPVGIFDVNRGYLAPTPLEFNNIELANSIYTLQPDGCIRFNEGGIYFLDFKIYIRTDDPTYPIDTTFLNLKNSLFRAGLNSIAVLNSNIYSDGTNAGSSTLWNNISNRITGFTLENGTTYNHTYAFQTSDFIRFPNDGNPLVACYFLDNDNSNPLSVVYYELFIIKIGAF